MTAQPVEGAPEPGFLAWLRFLAGGAILLMVHCFLSILASPGHALCVVPLILAPAHFVLRLSSRWSAGQLMDRVLVQVALLSPIANLLFSRVLPAFNVTRTRWPLMLIYQTLFGTIIVNMPPMHTIIHVIACALSFGYLELSKTHQLQAHALLSTGATSSGDRIAFLARFLFLHWLPVCFAAALIAIVAGASTMPAERADGEEQARPPPVPLESLGVHLFERLRLKGALQRYHALVAGIALVTASFNPLALLCMAVTIYYGIALILVRGESLPVLVSGSLSSEGLLLAMTATFIVGRESNSMDMRALVEVVQSQLAASHSLLMDQLPAHIVKAVLSKKVSSVPSGLKTTAAGLGAPAGAACIRSQSSAASEPRQAGVVHPMSPAASGTDLNPPSSWGDGTRCRSQPFDAGHNALAEQLSSCVADMAPRGWAACLPPSGPVLSDAPPSSPGAGTAPERLNGVVGAAHTRVAPGAPSRLQSCAAMAPPLQAGAHDPVESVARGAKMVSPFQGKLQGEGQQPTALLASSTCHAYQGREPPAQQQAADTASVQEPQEASSADQWFGSRAQETRTLVHSHRSSLDATLTTRVQQLRAALNTRHLSWLTRTPPSQSHADDVPLQQGRTADALVTSSAGQLEVGVLGLRQLSRRGRQQVQDNSGASEGDDIMASDHESVTIYFSDIVSFSSWAGRVEPAKVLRTINALYTRLDRVILQEFPSLYKIETIGDAYIVAANLLVPDPNHAATAVRFAVRAQEEAAQVARPDVDDGSTLQMRIGLHSGSISSGIVGKIRRRFVVYGEAMNLASRTETTCPPGCIQLTAATQELAAPALEGCISLVQRGEVYVKEREQPLVMYLVKDAGSEAHFVRNSVGRYSAAQVQTGG